jgi:LytS/YehU family sensor histidine kinase
MQTEKQNALRARAIAHEAQLTALRGQLNPHFLFNSLNFVPDLILHLIRQHHEPMNQPKERLHILPLQSSIVQASDQPNL